MAGLRLALSFARRELRGGTRGFRIFLACLALGVMVVAAVGTVSSAILAGLARDGRAILGGDVDLRLTHQPATAAQRAWIGAGTRVSETVEMRAMARPAAGGDRRLVELKAVDGAYPLFGAMTLAEALPGVDTLEAALAARDGLPGAVADRNLLTRLGLSLGDRVRVGEADFELRGTVGSEPDRAVSAFAFGPRLMIATDALGATGLVQPGSLIRFHYRIDLPAGATTARWTQALAEAFPDAAWRVRDVREAAPGIRRFVDRVGQFLTLVGLTALLVGGVGVLNAVRAYLEGKTPIIATLKCLGATGPQVFRIYFAQLAILAFGGIVIGLALGTAAPAIGLWLAREALPVPAVIGVYPGALLLATAFGALTALAFTLWPLARTRDVRPAALFRQSAGLAASRPRWGYVVACGATLAALAALAVGTASNQRLAAGFVGGAAAAVVVFQAIAWALQAIARRLPRPRRPGLRLALANLHRPGASTGSIVLSLGLGLTVLVAVAEVEGNLGQQVRDRLPDAAPGLYFIDIQPHQVASFEGLVGGFDGVERIDRVPMVRGRLVAVDGTPVSELAVPQEVAWVTNGDRGLTYAATPPEGSPVVEGEWWPAGYTGPPLVSVGAEIARAFGLGLGDTVTLNVLGRAITAEIASLRALDWSTLGINFIFVFAPGTLEAAPHTHIAAVHVADAAEAPLEAAVAERFPNVSAIRVKEALAAVNRILEAIGLAVRATAGVAILAGTLVLAGAVVAGHHRRVYDAVVLKVLGATRRHILTAYMLEYGLLGLVTATIAAGIGTAAAWYVVSGVMQADFVLLPLVMAGTALLCAAITLIVGFAGTWRALGQKAAPLLREE